MGQLGLSRWVLGAFVLALLFSISLGLGREAGAATAPAGNPQVVRELPELRTENSKTYLLSNGARQLEIHGGPIQFKDETGAWKDIDTSLVPSADGSLVSAATPVQVKLTKTDQGAPVVSLEYQGASVELFMKDHTFGAPIVDGSTATYSQVNPLYESSSTETTSAALPESETTESTTPPEDTTTDTSQPSEQTATVTSEAAQETTITDPADETTTSDTVPSTTTSDTTPSTLESTTTTTPSPDSDVTLSYEVTPQGLKENIILASADAPSRYTFTLKHPGLILKKDKTGQWGFYDAEENPHPLLALGNVEVYDSSQSEHGDPAYCNTAVMTVVPGKDESTVTYTVPVGWLTEPDRVFPVTIDPTVTRSPVADTYISSGYPDTSYGSGYQTPIGHVGAPFNWGTGFYRFTLPADLTSGGYVQSAHFQVYQYYQSTSTAQVARASAMTKSWSESSTYNSLGGKTWFGSDTRSVATTSAQAQWIDFDFTTTVQQWADGSRPNYGFTMYQSQSDYGQSPSWWRRVYTSNYSNSTYWPKLIITYTAPISVTSYGATSGDVPTGPNYADDTAAFQAAINAVDANGGVVTIPAGTYYVSGLSLTHSNVVLRGAGTSSIVLPNPNPHPSQQISQMVQIGGSSAVTNITVRDLYLRVPQDGYGVRLSGSGGGSDITLTGLALAGGGDSASHQAISVGSGFTDLAIQNNDLTSVSAVPVGVSFTGAGVSVSGNFGPYQAYRADFYQGTDQYDTAIRLSQARFPQGAPAAVLVAGDTWQEAMTASPLAQAYGGPVLFTQSSGLDTRTRAELQRLGATTLFVIGLTTSIRTAVADALPAASVTRIAGADIYATAALVATQVKTKLGSVDNVVLVCSDYYQTGIAVGAVAGYNGYPVLFTPRNGPVPTTTVNEIKTTLGLTTTVAVGINPSVTISGVTLDYINGDSPNLYDPYEIAERFNDGYVYNAPGQEPQANQGLATSTNYSDALALGAYLAIRNGVVYLTNGDTVPAATEWILRNAYPTRNSLTYVGRPNLWVDDENAGAWQPIAPRHTTYDFDSFADHQVGATLDQAALDLSTTDLGVASFGPRAAVDRSYSSSRTESRYFAPGWRFSFDRHLVTQSYSGFHDRTVDYIDEKGDVYTFCEDGAIWIPPPGFTGTLRGGQPEGWSNYLLTLPGGNTLTFTYFGELLSETDPNGNTVTYAWQFWGYTHLPTSLTITAANGQSIAVTFQVVNYVSRITQATYTTTNGTRTVTYATAAPWNVTYSYTGTPSTASRSLTYGYTASLLTALSANAFAGGQNATETFSYTSGKLTALYFPDYHATNNPDARASIDNGSQTATVHRFGRVYLSSTPSGAPGTEVTQTFTWTAAGAMTTKTNPKTSGDPTQTWTYTYSPHTNWLLSETSPLGKTRSWTYNNHGNVTSVTDELGHSTTYTYPDIDPVVQGKVTALLTADADDVYNANSVLRTDRYYLAVGRGTAVDKAGWRVRNLAIPQGATITNVQFKVYAYYDVNGSVTNLRTQLGVEDVDNSGAWVAGSHEPRLANITASYMNWQPTNTYGQPEWKAGSWYICDSSDVPGADPGLKNAVQTVVNRAGWASGNSLSVLWLDDGTAAVNLVNPGDYKNGTPASLTISYYTPNEGPDVTRDMPETATDPDDSLTTNYYDEDGNLPRVTEELSPTQTGDSTTVYVDQTAGTGTYHGASVQTRELRTDNGLAAPSAFENAAWTKSQVGVFADLMDSPLDGSPAADKICENNSSGYHYVSQPISSSALTQGKVYRFSAYVKPGGRSQVGIRFSSANGAFAQTQAILDIASGNVLSKTCQAAGIEAAGGGWYHIWADQPAAAGAVGVAELLLAVNGSLSYAGAGHSVVLASDPGVYAVGADAAEVVTADSSTQNFAPNGEPTRTVYKGVVLQDGDQGVDLTVSQTFDNFGNLLTGTDTANQVQVTNTYDLAGRLLTSTGPSFTATVGSPTSTQIVTHHSYDAWGHETESWKTSTGEAAQTKAEWTLSTYDKAGRVSQVQYKLSPSGSIQSTLTFYYDGRGALIYQKDSAITGSSASEKLPALTAYDARGNQVFDWAAGACTGDPVTLSGYDPAKATQHLNGTTPAYDAADNLLSTTGPGNTSPKTYTYTDDNRVLRETEPDGSWTEYTYDESGNVTHTKTSVSSPNYLTTSAYDEAGRKTSETDANGLTTTYTYDRRGNQLTAGAQGQTASQFTANNFGRQLKIRDADGFTTSSVFDAGGHLTYQTTAGYATTYTYQSGLPGGQVGLLSQKTEGASDRVATYTYDWFGRVHSELETAGGTTVKNTSTTHDSLGRVSTSTDNTRDLTHSFTYPQNTPANTTDAYGIGSSGSDLVTTTLTIAADGYETSRSSIITSNPQVPNLTRTISPRDNAQRVTNAALAAGQGSVYSQYSYDSAGRPKRQWGTTDGGSGYTSGAQNSDAYTYDATSGLKTGDNVQLTSVGTSGPATGIYTYQTNGRLASAATNGNASESYAYDTGGAGNIETAGSTTFNYRSGGNLLDYSTGAYARYYFFDPSGKWRTVQAPTNNQNDPNRETFAYTGTGRLQTYTKYVSGSVSLTGTYTYDAQGQRTKSVLAVTGGLTTTTNFTYEGLNLMSLSASQTGTGSPTSWKITYLYDELDRPYAGIYRNPSTSTTPVVFGMVTTNRGDVVELLDAAGNPFVAYRYDAWGNPQDSNLGNGDVATGIWSQSTGLISSGVATDIANRQVLRYAGYTYDSEPGLYYLSARSYDPKTRQFLSKDLSRNDGEQSAYQYCGGNPVANIDPTGYSLQTAYNLPAPGLTDSKKITISGNSVTIRWYCRMSGGFTATRTRGTIKHAIQDKWKGSYILKPPLATVGIPGTVTTRVTDLNDGGTYILPTGQKYSRVYYRNYLGTPEVKHLPSKVWSRSGTSDMYLYGGQLRDNPTGAFYSQSDFQVMAAHEFGHILGIADGYASASTRNINSIMCNTWVARKATSKDIQKALSAYKYNKTQYWYASDAWK